MDVPGEKLPQDMVKHLEQVVMPEIPEQLRPAFQEAVAAKSWRSMRNKSMPARPLHRPGALLLGKPLMHASWELAGHPGGYHHIERTRGLSIQLRVCDEQHLL